MEEEPRQSYVYKPKTPEEINQLASDIHAGHVFGTFNAPEHLEPRDYSMIFMPLVFLDGETRKEMVAQGVVHFYEYFDKAGPRSVNGMPSFMSMQFLNREDTDKVYGKLKKLAEATKEALQDG